MLLMVCYYEVEKLYFAAKVRNGFVPNLRREIYQKLKEMKNCRWLRPELVAQIEFTAWTPDGHLRHSTCVGLREDKGGKEE
jgi:bifunctional non-homologous end joining protein LigD